MDFKVGDLGLKLDKKFWMAMALVLEQEAWSLTASSRMKWNCVYILLWHAQVSESIDLSWIKSSNLTKGRTVHIVKSLAILYRRERGNLNEIRMKE